MIFHIVWSLENLESPSFLLAWLSYAQIVHEKILHRWFMPCIYRYVLPISPTARMKSCVLFLRGDQMDVYRKYFSFTLQFSNVEVFCFDLSYLIVWVSFEIQIHNWNASYALKWNLNSFIILSKLHQNNRMKISIWFMYLKILFVQFIFTSHIHHLLTLEAIHMNQTQIIYSSSAFFS